MLPKMPRITPHEAEAMLLKAGFVHIRSKGSHRIFEKGRKRFVVPFHQGIILHPKIIKSLLNLLEGP
jgi:predicted RNA binding protein YcfA (HicA-like mRNA interferase family)